MEETSTTPEHCEVAGKEAATSKESRKRKKRLLHQIADQMDFYFSAANITKDRFMNNLLSECPYINLETFFKFNKIRSMTNDIKFLRKAISKSSILELSDDGLKVRRKTDIEVKENELQCTIYVENIPSHADHDWVRQVFGAYGAIDYISLPRYYRSGRPKGFAFVEFKTPQMASSALEAFGALERKISPTIDPAQLQTIKTFEGSTGEQLTEEGEAPTIDPAQLQTIKTFEGSTGEQLTEEGEVPTIDPAHLQTKTFEGSTGEQLTEEGEAESHCDSESECKVTDNVRTIQVIKEEDERRKKRKLDDDTNKETIGKKRKTSQDENTSDNLTRQEEEILDAHECELQDGVDEEEKVSAAGKKRKKKKRKRNKKEKEVIDSIYLRVMSKEDWKKLRNQYLQAQRENMKLLKMQLQERHHWSQLWQHNVEWNTRCDTNYDLQQDAYQEIALTDNAPQKDQNLRPQFTPSSVIKISFEEPPQDPKKLRETIKEGGCGGVVYVDMSATERDVFVRFKSEEAATAYKKTGCWSRMEVLCGAEEKEYWGRIISCWIRRRNKKYKLNEEQPQSFSGELRGREKLLQKAVREAQNTNRNSHIVFDD